MIAPMGSTFNHLNFSIMIDNFLKRGMFYNIPLGVPEEVLELAYRYALIGGRFDSRRLLRCRTMTYDFTRFVDEGFWWDRTPEGESFWHRICLGEYRKSDARDPQELERLKNYVDFKPFK